MYSLSTCWNSHRHTDGRAMLREIRSLGFEFSELSHGIRVSLLPGILDAVDAGEIRISTLHNFCPLPMGVSHAAPNIFKFSSPDPRERESAYKHSLKTIELAQRVGARLVVLHMGDVEMKEYTDKLVDLVGEGKRETPKFEKLCGEMVEKREQKKDPFVKLSLDMLRRLAETAGEAGIMLGIENREACEEIPFETDLADWFDQFPGDVVRYWHDCGHAQIKEHLGMIDHAFHLAGMADKLAGFHIHDVEFPGRDHRRPGSGCIKWTALKPMVRPEHIKVLEFSPSLSQEDVVAGAKFMRETWGE